MHHKKSIHYITHQPMTADQVLEKAAEILANKHLTSDAFTSSQATMDFLKFKLAKYKREVVKAVLNENGAAVIFAHNHPSGETEPSQADIAITKRLKEALALIDVQVLDHIVIGDSATSFAERGLL